MTHTRPAHYGGLCEEEHWCPACEDGTGEHVDLFMHNICGLVACASDEEGPSEATGADLTASGAENEAVVGPETPSRNGTIQ